MICIIDIPLAFRQHLCNEIMVQINNVITAWYRTTFWGTGNLWVESRGVPREVDSKQRANNKHILSYVPCKPEQAFEQTVQLLLIWDAMTRMCYHCNGGIL